MSRDALTRLFPDGKTVFIPADGQPMPGYDLAKAEIEQRGGEIQTASGGVALRLAVRRARRRRRRRRGGGRTGGDCRWRPASSTAAAPAAERRWRQLRAPVEIAEAGPEAVAKAKAQPADRPGLRQRPRPAPAAAGARAALRLSQRPSREVVAALEQPAVESDAVARTRRQAHAGRSPRSISRRCRRGGRPISSSNLALLADFPCRRSARPTSPRRSRPRRRRFRRPGPPIWRCWARPDITVRSAPTAVPVGRTRARPTAPISAALKALPSVITHGLTRPRRRRRWRSPSAAPRLRRQRAARRAAESRSVAADA